jgi:hypothetical protein
MSNGVDPNIAAILPLLPLKDAANLTPKRARNELLALTKSRKDLPLPQDILVEGGTGSIPARMYRASSSASLPNPRGCAHARPSSRCSSDGSRTKGLPRGW